MADLKIKLGGAIIEALASETDNMMAAVKKTQRGKGET